MQKVSTFLWFDTQAEEAANFYASLFKNSETRGHLVPLVLSEMLQDKDREKAGRVMKAMLQMKKIDIPTLEQAYRVDA